MYFYIFAPRGDEEIKYFERNQGRLLNLLAENNIEGETYRVTPIRTVEHLVEQSIGADSKTIVIVGSDDALNRAISVLVARSLPDVTVGFIPLGSNIALSNILGIGDLEQATKVLAGRLKRKFDLGEVGGQKFLSKLDLGDNVLVKTEAGFMGMSAARNFMSLQPFVIQLSIEGSYVATSEVLAVQIVNTRDNAGCRLKLGDPTDGLLDILLLNKLSSPQVLRYRRELASGCIDNIPGSTIMHAKKIEVLGPKRLPIMVGGAVVAKAPATIQVAKEKIKMIVGRTRQV